MNLFRFPALAGLWFVTTAIHAQITVASYSNDFTSSAADFTTTKPSAGAWTLDTVAPGYFGHTDAGDVNGTYAAAVQHTLLGGSAATAVNFTFGASVLYSAAGVASSNTLGVGFLNTSASLASSSGYWFYIRGVASPNDATGKSIFLMRNEVVVASAGSTGHEMRDYFGDVLSYQVSASYIDAVGGDGINDSLSLSVTFTNLTNSDSFTLDFVDGAPLTGNYFGMRAQDQSPVHALNAQWDSFSLAAIPEPSAYAALAGAAVLGLAALRRRRC